MPPDDAVMDDYLLRRFGTGSAPRVDIAQKPALAVFQYANSSPPQSRIISAAVCRAS